MMKYYAATIIFCTLAMLILVSMAVKNDTLCKRMKTGIVLSALMIIAAACCEYLGVALNGSAEVFIIPHRVVEFLELSLAPMIPIIYANAMYPVKSTMRLVVPLTLHTTIEFLSIWFGIVFYVDDANIYHHCAFYWLYYAAYFSGAIFLIVQISRFTKYYQSPNRMNLVLIMGFILIGILWQAIDSSLRIVWLAMAIGNIMFYNYYCDMIQKIDGLTHLLNRRNGSITFSMW